MEALASLEQQVALRLGGPNWRSSGGGGGSLLEFIVKHPDVLEAVGGGDGAGGGRAPLEEVLEVAGEAMRHWEGGQEGEQRDNGAQLPSLRMLQACGCCCAGVGTCASGMLQSCDIDRVL